MKLHEWARTTGAECVINELVSDEQKKNDSFVGISISKLTSIKHLCVEIFAI